MDVLAALRLPQVHGRPGARPGEAGPRGRPGVRARPPRAPAVVGRDYVFDCGRSAQSIQPGGGRVVGVLLKSQLVEEKEY